MTIRDLSPGSLNHALLSAASLTEPRPMTDLRQDWPIKRASTAASNLTVSGLLERAGKLPSVTPGPPRCLFRLTPAGAAALAPQPGGAPALPTLPPTLQPESRAAKILLLLTRHAQSLDQVIAALGLPRDQRPAIARSGSHLRQIGYALGHREALTVSDLGETEQRRLIALRPPEPVKPPGPTLSPAAEAERRKLARVSARARNAYAVLRQLKDRSVRNLEAQGGYSPDLAEEIWDELHRAGLT